jgi:hypothetical protein
MNVDRTGNYKDYSSRPIPIGQRSHADSDVKVAAFRAALACLQAPFLARFRRLREQWMAETENASLVEDMTGHPAYREIIGMGPAVIPLLLDELEIQPHHWFAALHAVTGYNPVRAEDEGNIDKMAEAWMTWAVSASYR